MYSDIKNEITRDFLDLKKWISRIPSKITEEDDFYIISRGLFFVYVYGIYEKIIHEVVYRTIDILNKRKIHIDKCIYDLYTLAFSNEFDGFENVGREHKWEKRWEICEKMAANPMLIIPDKLFPTDGKNIRYKQLNSIAKSFGMKENILPRDEIGGYLNEMVDNRNAIAHGDKTPKDIGKNYTKDDLRKKCEIISEICEYTVEIYENYINERSYMK